MISLGKIVRRVTGDGCAGSPRSAPRVCMGKAWVNQHIRHPSPFPQENAPVLICPGDTVTDATDEALALTVPCPRTACAAFCGEQCVTYATGRPALEPHPERIAAARAEAPR